MEHTDAYLPCMFRFEFCLPTTGKVVTSAHEWFHEIKYDGFRLMLQRDGARVRLLTKGGYDWAKRYPRIVEAALRNRQQRFVIDGEAIIRGVDGYSDFNALHSGKQNDEVELIAFDILALDGDDLRKLPLSMRKANLARLLARRPDGSSSAISNRARSAQIYSKRLAGWALEGLVSKRADRPYRGGRSRDWIKVKNRDHQAFERVKESFS